MSTFAVTDDDDVDVDVDDVAAIPTRIHGIVSAPTNSNDD